MRNRIAPVFYRPIIFVKTFRRCLLIALLFIAFIGSAAAQSSSPGRGRASGLREGINLYSQGKWQDAVLELRRVQAEATSNNVRGEALYWISLAQLSAGEYEEALRDMDTLEEMDHKHRRIAELSYHRGRAFYYLGFYDEALILLKEYADSLIPGPGVILSSMDSSKRSSALYWAGECLYSMGQLDRASDIFQLIIEEYPRSPKYEASTYRVAMISQKKVELELMGLLKWTHEESLKNMEEHHRKEAAYDQALNAYQKRLSDMQQNSGASDLAVSNARYREQLDSAEERIRYLENALRETVENQQSIRDASSASRLETMKMSAEEVMKLLEGDKK